MASSSDLAAVAQRSPRSAPRASSEPVGRHCPGQGSMWFFVIGDLWIFTCYFACYIHDRARHPEPFLQGQQLLSQGIGALNTVILLTSSLFVALCVQATRAKETVIASRFLALGSACGVLFVLVKAGEWYLKIRAGFPDSADSFFVYYFMFTGLHLVHVLLGLVILALLWRDLRGAEQPRAQFAETCATYWHMVDSLWIAIFALLYLVR
jgi:nitric oxide reductase NorE protein